MATSSKATDLMSLDRAGNRSIYETRANVDGVMSYEPRTYTDEEILADWELKAHWETVARTCPADAGVYCHDYAAHYSNDGRMLADGCAGEESESRLAFLSE